MAQRSPSNIKLAIQEAEFAVKELGLDSIIVYQNVNGKDLDSEFLWPFYEAAERLGAPISVHGVDSGPLLGVNRPAGNGLRRPRGGPAAEFFGIKQ
ncbi:MAG: hypothetical protein FJ145_01640 [Deltaproteobacteria bacterium]|nr:hypothetical protein [Deltaproteobacteria bacterium]